MTDHESRASRFAFFLLSLLFLFWAAWGHSIPAPAVRWTVAVGGLALGLLGWTHRTPLEAFGRWTALAVAGQACALQLLNAGKDNRLQLFHEWERLLTTYRVIFLFLVLLQGALVFWGAWRLWKAKRSEWSAVISPRQALALFALCAFAVVPVAPATVRAFLDGELAYRLTAQASKLWLGLFLFAVSGLNLFLAALAIPQAASERWASWWKMSDRRWLPWACAIWAVIVSSLLAWFVFERLPHVPDEVAYLFHAKYFAAGKLFLPLPPEPEAFSCTLMLFEGNKWFSAQLPGWPAVLAVGAWAGVPWLVNPLLGGLAILLTHVLVRRLYGQSVADGTILLLSFSPWFLYMSASLFGHPASLVFTLGGLLGVERAREAGRLSGALAAGFFFGALAMVRPLEAVALAGVAGLWWLGAGWKRLRVAALLATIVAGLAMTGLHLAYNRALTGNAFYLPFEKIFDQAAYQGANRVGFGSDVGNLGWAHLDPLPGHGPIDVVINTNQNLYMVNFELFGWGCGSLVFVFLLVIWRRARADLLMWGLVCAAWLGMSTYWFSGGPDLGARYWYQMVVPLAVLTVFGVQEFAARLHSQGARPEPNGLCGQTAWAVVALASLLGLVNLVPWRGVDKYMNYRYVGGHVGRLAREHQFGRSLVFVRGEGPLAPWSSSAFASAFALNPLTFDPDAPGPIYVRDLGVESRERLRRYYPDRPAWILGTTKHTSGEFQLLEGPIPPPGKQKE